MHPSTLTHSQLLRKRRSLRRELLEQRDLQPLRVAVLGGVTTNELCDFLEIALLCYGFEPTFHQSNFGAYFEESVLAPEALIAFRPDLVIVHTSYRNLQSPPTWQATNEDFEACVASECGRLQSVWDAVSAHVGCQVIQNNFDVPPTSDLGNLDVSHRGGRTAYVNAVNGALARLISDRPTVRLNDLATLAARMGTDRWHDDSRWYSFKLAHTAEANLEIARSQAALIAALYGKSRKCLVLDLDNTLWGGVIGDDGVDRIRIGRETAESEAFTAFQEYCLRLRDRGVLLAICSKNNHDTAMEGLRHPDSVLRQEHFAAIRANWSPKHENILSIANELKLGVDSFVFVDDNPAERALVAAQLPMVAVPDVGNDPATFARTIDRARYFEAVALSTDDLARSDQYKANAERATASAQFADYGEYLASLSMSAEIESFQPAYLDRIAQLTNKTNQYNLTTKRMSRADIEAMVQDDSWIALYGKLTDKFGDNGLVSVVAGRAEDDVLVLELWLMSCRVLKRDMEFAMLDRLVQLASERGITTLIGHYIPTAKNGMVADHYARLGFTQLAEVGDGGSSSWALAVAEHVPRNQFILLRDHTSV